MGLYWGFVFQASVDGVVPSCRLRRSIWLWVAVFSKPAAGLCLGLRGPALKPSRSFCQRTTSILRAVASSLKCRFPRTVDASKRRWHLGRGGGPRDVLVLRQRKQGVFLNLILRPHPQGVYAAPDAYLKRRRHSTHLNFPGLSQAIILCD